MSEMSDEISVVEKRREEHFVLRPGIDIYQRKIHKDQKYLSEILEIFGKWEPQHEVWVYKYGPLALGAASWLTSSYVNYYFRETLYLLNYTRVTSYAIMLLAPGFSAAFLHYMFVTTKILTERPTSCPTCLQIRGMALQTICSVGYPLILVPVICYPAAKRLQKYSVPNISFKNRYPVLKFTAEMLRPIRGLLWATAAAQMFLGMGMTYYEQSNFVSTIKPKLVNIRTHNTAMFPIPQTNSDE